jgi:hypothetical protein
MPKYELYKELIDLADGLYKSLKLDSDERADEAKEIGDGIDMMQGTVTGRMECKPGDTIPQP